MEFVKKVFASVITFALLGLVVFWFAQHDAVNNTKNIEFIEAHMYNGKVIDLQNEVGVQSVDDVRWYYDDHDVIVIEYGKIMLKYKLTDFVTKDIQDALNRILITTEQNKVSLEFTLYWDGQEITKYVKR